MRGVINDHQPLNVDFRGSDLIHDRKWVQGLIEMVQNQDWVYSREHDVFTTTTLTEAEAGDRFEQRVKSSVCDRPRTRVFRDMEDFHSYSYWRAAS
ncbi:hypothetical protein Maqu_4057 (plasmid) [Marinobacter nauticus VT8]|uniref:Uncharacterized protein n=1 Tax=Marinobacter nauticus (strain ATCC 700491 / DSM 11845 / VT8) TaxID=351348 RepID=A1U8L1_MARN8|nr:hypothetical protein Maqu_4057 [Marinobacter nauticus VT8]